LYVIALICMYGFHIECGLTTQTGYFKVVGVLK